MPYKGTKMKTATLLFIKSKNAPVFSIKERISYTVAPKVGHPFLFNRACGLYGANLSAVKKITKYDDFQVIQTRNSYYVLINGESK